MLLQELPMVITVEELEALTNLLSTTTQSVILIRCLEYLLKGQDRGAHRDVFLGGACACTHEGIAQKA